MLKKEYDFLNWKSCPSSAKLINDEAKRAWVIWRLFDNFSATPGAKLRLELKAKQQDVTHEFNAKSDSVIMYFDGATWKWLGQIVLPPGTFDWRDFSTEATTPSDAKLLSLRVTGGSGVPELPGITWYDDLKLYQDNVLIYSNDFSNWNPVIGAGVGAVAVGATSYEATKKPEIAVPAALVGAGAGAGLGLFGPDAWSALIQVITKEPMATLAAGMAPVIAVGGAIAASELQKAHIFG